MPYVMTQRDRDVLLRFGQAGRRLRVVPASEFSGLVGPAEYSFNRTITVAAMTFVIGGIFGYFLGRKKD